MLLQVMGVQKEVQRGGILETGCNPCVKAKILGARKQQYKPKIKTYIFLHFSVFLDF